MAHEIRADQDEGRVDDPARGWIATLAAIAADAEHRAPGAAVPLADIFDRLDERGFGLLIFLLSLPCLVPALPGGQVLAVPILLLAAQWAVGRAEPWLPPWVRRLQVKTAWLRRMADFAARRLSWLERIAHPRLPALAAGPGERAAAAIAALAALAMMLPVTNVVPALGVALIALGAMARDGAFILVGIAVAFAWIAFVALVLAALISGADVALDLVRDQAPALLGPFSR